MSIRWFSSSVVLILVLSLGVAAQTADYDALVAKGRDLLNSGSALPALNSAEQAISAKGDRWEAYALAGAALTELKRYEDAADRFTHAIALAPAAKQDALRDLRREALAAETGTNLAGPMSTSQVTQAEVVLWKSIENSSDPQGFRGYLTQYPHGAFAAVAQARIEQLTRAAEEKEKADQLAELQKTAFDKQHIPVVHQHNSYHPDDFGRLTFTPNDVTFTGVQHQFHFTREQISQVKLDCRLACGLQFYVIGEKRYTFIAVSEDAFEKKDARGMWNEAPSQLVAALRQNWGWDWDKEAKAFHPAPSSASAAPASESAPQQK